MPEETTNVEVSTDTVSKAEHEKVIKERDGLQESHKALQRSYENLRRSGGSTADLAKRMEANEKLQLSILETLGNLGVEGVDVKPAIEAYKKERETTEQVDGVKAAASEAIVAAFEAAGITEVSFETTWATDPRFEKARSLFNSGKYTDSARESITVLATKVLTEEDVKKAADEAVARDRQARAAAVDPGSKTSSNVTTWAQAQKAKSVSDVSDEAYEQLIGKK